ncbi:MFS transporter [Yunchengibacter salinarum]|uniref:MFS transporter n=1 Tax=Yunchengibacter salinarum TaxID=3133399 RepID=UPI0035B6485B
MKRSALSLLTTRRFAPLFGVQFLGAMNDNLFRASVIMLITYRLAEGIGIPAGVLNNAALALFILPYLLFSALAGQLADKYDKAPQVRWIKLWEVLLMLTGALALHLENIVLMLAVLFGLGLQSTFFGPIKYAVMPEQLDRRELLAGNALIEAGTFLAILLGTIIGGLLVLRTGGGMMVSALTIGAAVAGLGLAGLMPRHHGAAPGLRVRRNVVASTRDQLVAAFTHPIARPAILGISWIWLFGSLYLTQIPVVTKDHLGGNEQVVTLILSVFSIGIGAGALASNRLLKGAISARLVAPGLLVLLAASGALYVSVPPPRASADLMGLVAFLAEPLGWGYLALFLLIAAAGGSVIVPLYAILQDRSDDTARSRMIAANNVVNSLFMAGGSLVAAWAVGMGAAALDVLAAAGLVNLLMLYPALRLDGRLSLERATGRP